MAGKSSTRPRSVVGVIEPTDRSQRLAQRPAVMMPYSGVTNSTLVSMRLPISLATSMSKPLRVLSSPRNDCGGQLAAVATFMTLLW
ncbi:hypothetical protein D3C81_1409710 [compost metagenome]